MSKLSADNFKKMLDLDGSTPEPAIRSGDTGQRIPCFDSCQLTTTLMCISAFSWAPKVARKCEGKHWYAWGADGRSVGHVITKFSGMGRFIYPWCSAGALRADCSVTVEPINQILLIIFTPSKLRKLI